MKKAIRIILPIFLALCILVCTAWYLFVYDRAFTRDVLLSLARYSESAGNHKTATWFYNRAYAQSGDSEAVAIELAEQYKSSGNFTKAEYTLSQAIADGGGAEVYIALCKTYVQQDKLLDAVTMLDNITNPEIKAELNALRPAAPTSSPAPGYYSQYLSVTIAGDGGAMYVSSDGNYPTTARKPYSEPVTLTDGENTIYAVTVADNGLVSPLSIFGYTVGGVITKMEFADSAMEAEIRKLLEVDDQKELFNNDLWGIRSFTMPNKVANYGDLQQMVFLETLTIENGKAGQISNLSALVNLSELKITGVAISQEELSVIAALPKLKKLTLNGCSLVSISALQKASGITYLDVSRNNIRNIDAIRAMANLQELHLQNNAVTDLSALSSVTTLEKLNVASNQITSLATISPLTRLKYLDANTNVIAELGELGKLTALTYLNLASNKLTKVNTLAGCTALQELNISTNSITDITPLKALVKMMTFNFSYNQVTKLPSFPKKCELTTITGSNNKLTSLDPLSGLANLNIVNMDYNAGISSVKALASCPVLIEVNVYGTKVTNVKALTDQSIIVNYNPVS